MERFRLRVRHEPKRGHIWELHLFPDQTGRSAREADARVLGSSSVPAVVLWLRQIAAPYLAHAVEPGPVAADEFGPRAEPRWLGHEDGMRLALAFSAARYLATPRQRSRFREGLDELPSEVVLYWFTLCFYGYRQAAGRAALRALLAYEDPLPRRPAAKLASVVASRANRSTGTLDLFTPLGTDATASDRMEASA